MKLSARLSSARLLPIALFALSLAASAQTPPAQNDPAPPDLVLSGKVTGTQNHTYIEVPFEVPAGIHRISVDFSYTGHEARTTLDLGIEDPYRFRGESGGNKSHFTLSETDATPSYLPGPILAGRWHLLLAVPNIRAASVATFRAEIRFNSHLEDSSFTLAPLEQGSRWYRGDLHMHTAHSDGSCAGQSGRRVPCPLFFTAQTAASRGLDFIAISDHNVESQYNEMRELQPWFDRLLFIPAREMTTFWGHFNIYGTTQPIDYRVAAHNGRDYNAILREVAAKGAIASINHAEAPGGEVCMGCRWEPPMPVDMSLFTGVEVINGGSMLFSSDAFWEQQLRDGHRLTAVGGSDSHNALAPAQPPNSIGFPTTVVEARELSVAAILDGIRHGRVFIDLTGSRDKRIDIDAEAGAAHARMGEDLVLKNGEAVHLSVHVAACAHDALHLFVDGKETAALPAISIDQPDQTLSATWTAAGSGRHWIRAEVHDSSGRLLLFSNPVYINFP
ncbi:CehA/McbA family metallohydrolase [Paracidobacterium acidisoli]|uniref:PHP domain-containing protein n=1 Tax=Paracidobacterium acidisoli TaxID=2303751 RepID=A0A372IKC7_9BACT|nr:CehA/McbA family metallohydrolase [Paracidobacterium acidisoli]MBT9332700.1 CehA/McbA family metallohydrolase [Paracidobacterium acidisoli]